LETQNKNYVMVNIIENKAKINGKVNAINDNGPSGYSQIEVELQNSDEVGGYPNLAKADEGSVITINVKPQQISDANIVVGNNLSATVRKVFGQKYFMDSEID
jgi:hypothetical protein